MTKHQSRGFAVRAESRGPITFLASTDALIKQDGLSIERGAWRFDRYRKNPIILFGHDLMGQRLPIGRATKYGEDSRGLIVEAEFDQGDDFAREVERKLRQGYLNGISISWDTLRREGSKVKEAELIEVSVVPVPADANAVAIARSAYRGEGDTSGLRNVLAAMDKAGWKARPTANDRATTHVSLLAGMGPQARMRALRQMSTSELEELDRSLQIVAASPQLRADVALKRVIHQELTRQIGKSKGARA